MFHSLTYRTWWSFSKHSLLHAACPNSAVRFQKCTRRCCTMYLVVTSAAFRTSNHLEMYPPQGRRNFRLRLKYDGTCAESRFCLSTKWTSPFKSVGASVLSTACRRGVRISLSNAGYTTFRGGVSIRQFPLHFPSRVPPGSEWAVHTDILKDCWAFILRVRKSRSYDYTAWLCRWRHCVLILWNASNYLSFGMI